MKARQKPIEIEVFQLPPLGDETHAIPMWLIEAQYGGAVQCPREGVLEIHTLEGVMTAGPGDYIAKGVKDELYPIKADIFAATYDIIQE